MGQACAGAASSAHGLNSELIIGALHATMMNKVGYGTRLGLVSPTAADGDDDYFSSTYFFDEETLSSPQMSREEHILRLVDLSSVENEPYLRTPPNDSGSSPSSAAPRLLKPFLPSSLLLSSNIGFIGPASAQPAQGDHRVSLGSGPLGSGHSNSNLTIMGEKIHNISHLYRRTAEAVRSPAATPTLRQLYAAHYMILRQNRFPRTLNYDNVVRVLLAMKQVDFLMKKVTQYRIDDSEGEPELIESLEIIPKLPTANPNAQGPDHRVSGGGSHRTGHRLVTVTEFAPRVFHALRVLEGIHDSPFIREWDIYGIREDIIAGLIEHQDISRTTPTARGAGRLELGEGRSQALFLKSKGLHYMCKTISEGEAEVLIDVLPFYAKYCASNRNSLLSRFLMLLKLEVLEVKPKGGAESGNCSEVVGGGYILCFTDVFKACDILDERWDIKGRRPKPGKYRHFPRYLRDIQRHIKCQKEQRLQAAIEDRGNMSFGANASIKAGNNLHMADYLSKKEMKRRQQRLNKVGKLLRKEEKKREKMDKKQDKYSLNQQMLLSESLTHNKLKSMIKPKYDEGELSHEGAPSRAAVSPTGSGGRSRPVRMNDLLSSNSNGQSIHYDNKHEPLLAESGSFAHQIEIDDSEDIGTEQSTSSEDLFADAEPAAGESNARPRYMKHSSLYCSEDEANQYEMSISPTCNYKDSCFDESGPPPRRQHSFTNAAANFSRTQSKGDSIKSHYSTNTTIKTLKDKDLARLFWLETEKRDQLIQQLNSDFDFLLQCGLMDYSLLIGVRYNSCEESQALERQYREECEERALKSKSLSSPLFKHLDMQKMAEAAKPPAVLGEEHTVGQREVRDPTLLSSDSPQAHSTLPQVWRGDAVEEGPLPDGQDSKYNSIYHAGVHSVFFTETYFIGIIDILTKYNWKKKIANFCKTFLWKPETLSTIPPHAYFYRLSTYSKKIFPRLVLGHNHITGRDHLEIDNNN